MASEELSKLSIDRSIAPVRTRRRRKWLWLGGILLVAIAGGGWFASQPRTITVQTTPIVTTYPSQQFVVINSTGYVVAQRKAAISSKASGRLEWLGVAEGSRVKAGEVIARLDESDVRRRSRARAPMSRSRAPRWNKRRRRIATRASSLKRNADLDRAEVRLRVGARSGQGARRSRGRRHRERQGRAWSRRRPTRAIRRSPSTTP